MINNRRYVIFDLDGTLIDSFDTIVHHCVLTCDYLGCNVTAFDFESFRHFDLHELFTTLTSEMQIDLDTFKIVFDSSYLKEPLHRTKILDKGYELLKRVKDNGYGCIVLTNKYQSIAELVCNELFGNNLIDIVIGRNCTKPIKPTENVLLRLQSLGIQTDQIYLYYGDSNTDEQSASILKTKFIKIDC